MTDEELNAIIERWAATESLQTTIDARAEPDVASTLDAVPRLVEEIRRLRTAAGAAVALVERNFGTSSGRDFRQLFGLPVREEPATEHVDPSGLPRFKSSP